KWFASNSGNRRLSRRLAKLRVGGALSRKRQEGGMMNEDAEVLCAGIIVADHVCAPISHLPAAGELVMAERLILTIGGCAANAAVDLSKMGVRASVVGRVGRDVFGRV